MDNRSVTLKTSDLSNQRIYRSFLEEGFRRLGYNITNNGNINVCIGPHHAMRQCEGTDTIYIDRCLWGDDIEYVTVGWLKNGAIDYPFGCDNKRPKPKIKPWKTGDIKKVLFLLDYGPYPETYLLAKEIYETVDIRPHPATGKKLPPLNDQLQEYDLAIGYRTSALFTAVCEGLPVISLDSRSSVYNVAGHDLSEIVRPDRTQWLNNMSYAQWSGQEIRSGEALKYAIDYRARARAGNPPGSQAPLQYRA